jgi:tetratricopeptide (TPR) repeat protein
MVEDSSNDFEAAARHYRKAIEGDPKDPFTWYNLGVVLSKAQKLDDSLQALSKCTRIDPEFPECWYAWGAVSAALGKLKDARKAVQKLKKLKSDLAGLLEQQLK